MESIEDTESLVRFKLNGWTLEEYPGNMVLKHSCDYEIYNSKQPYAVPKVFVYVSGEMAAYCWRCTKPIPASIEGLYRMYEWDRL